MPACPTTDETMVYAVKKILRITQSWKVGWTESGGGVGRNCGGNASKEDKRKKTKAHQDNLVGSWGGDAGVVGKGTERRTARMGEKKRFAGILGMFARGYGKKGPSHHSPHPSSLPFGQAGVSRRAEHLQTAFEV